MISPISFWGETFLFPNYQLIEMNPISQKDGSPLVSISCITYNHAPYIRQCLDGFMMQKTNFAFEVLIHDDASTDGTTEIIKEYAAKYPDIIKPLYEEENQWVKGRRGSAVFNYPRAKGKYIAMCEGDDYWIDPLKLQKQVDFLEDNPEYGIVRTNVHSYIQKEGRLEENFFSHRKWAKIKDTYHDYIIHGWFAAPCTWMYRSEYVVKYASFNEKDCFTGDIALLLCITQESKIKYLPESTAVYRVLEKSASHFDDFKQTWNFFIKNKNTRLYFAKKEHFAFRLKCWFLISCNYFMILLRHKRAGLMPNWFMNTLKDFLIVF